MAVDESGKQQARLISCLAILRYTVATVVTVLAFVVIVMVIAVGVRPGNVSVSIVQGHVTTSHLWNETSPYNDTETTVVAAEAVHGSHGGRRGTCGGLDGRPTALGVACGTGGSEGSAGFGSYGPPSSTVYTPVEALSLEVTLSVDNKSGRGSISCSSINVTFRVGSGMEIGMLTLPRTLDFHAKPQTSHKIFRHVTFNDKAALKYIADNYGGEYSFTGTVEVTMNTSSVVLGHHTRPRIVTLVCSQVDFSVGEATASATSVQCTN